jgi:hypothetical protein
VNAARPLHLTQRTNAQASPNVCVGPQAEVGTPTAKDVGPPPVPHCRLVGKGLSAYDDVSASFRWWLDWNDVQSNCETQATRRKSPTSRSRMTAPIVAATMFAGMDSG